VRACLHSRSWLGRWTLMGDADRVLPEEPHAARAAQVTASAATLVNGCLGVFRLLMAFMVSPSPRRRAHLRFAA